MKLFHTRQEVLSTPVQVQVTRIVPVPAEGISWESLRRQLFAAAALAARGNDQKLLLLCQRHGRVIFGRASIWNQVPPAFRSSPALVNWYREGLRIIGGFYSEQLGRPQPTRQIRPATAVRS